MAEFGLRFKSVFCFEFLGLRRRNLALDLGAFGVFALGRPGFILSREVLNYKV